MLHKTIIIVFLLFVISFASESQIKSAFVPSIGHGNYHSYKQQINSYFNQKEITWEEKGFYIVFQDENDKKPTGLRIAFLALNSLSIKVYRIPAFPLWVGPDGFRIVDCVEKTIQNNQNHVQKKCKKISSVSKDFYDLIEKFFIEKKESIKNIGKDHSCYYSLYIVYLDDNKNYHYFDMISPKCIDEKMMKNSAIHEYIQLYNEIRNLLNQDFNECRWDNFNNKKEIEEKCGKYNVYQ